MRCEKCGSEMKEINRECRMDELDDDATEGQMADYMAAELSGDYGDWGVVEITYKCGRCGDIQHVVEI